MIVFSKRQKFNRFGIFGLRSITSILVCSLVFGPSISYAQHVSVLGLPKPGVMVTVSKPLNPVLLKGLKIDSKNPLLFDFLVSKGKVFITGQEYKEEIERLAKYFLASLTIPEKDLWVNLSPYESKRVIAPSFGETEMGRDMLAQDYILKQLTASMIYPEDRLGHEFWQRVYQKAKAQYGTTEIPINTFNKVWILADSATVVEKNDRAFIVNARLKVMLEEDYLALRKNSGRELLPVEGSRIAVKNEANTIGSQIIREIVIPELEKEVNTGANFANLRQIFHAFVLATWYKKALKQAILNQVYTNKFKIAGITSDDPKVVEKIYSQYLQAYKKGVFNFIKEEPDGNTGKNTVRKYFSGGTVLSSERIVYSNDLAQLPFDALDEVAVLFSPDTAMVARAFAPSTFSPPGMTPAGQKTYSPDNVRHLKLSEPNKSKILAARNIKERFAAQFVAARRFLGGKARRMRPDDPEKSRLNEAVLKIDDVEVKLVDPGVLRYGYALDKVNNIIYLDKKGEGMVQNPDYFEFLTREIIRMVAGHKYAYLYAFENYTDKVRDKFGVGSGSEPTEIIRKNREALLLPVDEQGKPVPQTADALEKIIQGIIHDSPARKLVPIPPDDNSYNIMRESNALMEENFYEIGVYFLNDIVDKSGDLKAFMNHFNSSLTMMRSFLVFFATKANPITLAHLNVTIASVMKEAIRYFGQGEKLTIMDLVNISKEDPLRKPQVGKTYEPRLYFASFVLSAIFGAIVQTLPEDKELEKFIDYLKRDSQLSQFVSKEEVGGVPQEKVFDRLNGEENLHRLIRVFHIIGIKMFGYPIGGDHLRVFAKREGGDFVKADHIDNQLTRDLVVYYPKINPRFYADLIIGQHQSGGTKIFDETSRVPEQVALKKLYEALLNAKNDNEIFHIVENAAYLPSLDTCGKLAIINSEYGNDMDLVLFHTVRGGEDITDVFRDQLTKGTKVLGRAIKGVPIIDVKGIKAPMNAAGIREALIKVVRDGVFDFNGFSSSNLTLLKYLFDPVNKRMLNIILRQQDNAGNDLILPKSVQRTWYPDYEDGRQELEDHLLDLKRKLGDMWGREAQIDIEETRTTVDVKQREKKGGHLVDKKMPGTMLTLKVNGKATINLAYYVINSFGQNGEEKNKIVFIYNPILSSAIDSLELIKGEESSFNQATDSAMSGISIQPIAHSRQVQGGIEFSSNDLNLNFRREGQEVQMPVDEAQLAILKSNDFTGLGVKVISITPLPSVVVLFSLKEEEPAQRLVGV